MTLIAMNSIKMGGNPDIIPAIDGDAQPNHPLRNLQLVSGNDFQISGNVGNVSRPGANLAHQQVKYNGNPVVHGYIQAEHGGPCPGDPAPNYNSSEHVADINEISGNMVITYSGLDTIHSGSTLALIPGSWNEVRAP